MSDRKGLTQDMREQLDIVAQIVNYIRKTEAIVEKCEIMERYRYNRLFMDIIVFSFDHRNQTGITKADMEYNWWAEGQRHTLRKHPCETVYDLISYLREFNNGNAQDVQFVQLLIRYNGYSEEAQQLLEDIVTNNLTLGTLWVEDFMGWKFYGEKSNTRLN
jgi:hypothetical protein